MAEVQGLNVKVGLDSTGFQNGISNLNRQLRVVQSEFQATGAALRAEGKSFDELRAKSDSLAKQTEIHRQRVATLQQAYEESAEKKGVDAKATQDLEIKLNRAKAVLAETEAELKKTNKEIDLQSSSWYKLSQNCETASKKLEDIGKKMTGIGKDLSKKVTAPIVALGTAAVVTTAQFDDQMSRVQSISGATGDELEKLREQAKDFGRDTRYSAKQAAEGMENLASSGFEVNEIMDAMSGLLNLASSGGIELAQASDIAASTLRGFNLAADQAGRVADVLAKAAADTNAQVGDLGEGMKYVAPVAVAMGVSLEDTAAAMGLLANAGIKGSQGGTTLRAALSSLAKPSKEAAKLMDELGIAAFDAQGQMVPLPQLVANLKDSMSSLTQEQQTNAMTTIFGQRAMSGMLALVNAGPDAMQRLSESFVDASGAAAEMARINEDNLAGSWRSLKSAMESASIAIGERLAPKVREISEWLTELVRRFSELSPKQQDMIIKLGLTAAAIGPVLVVLGKMSTGASAVIGVVGKLSATLATTAAATTTVGTAATAAGTATAAVGTAAGVALAPVLAITGALAAAGAAGYALYRYLSQDTIPSVNLFGKEVSSATKEAVGGFFELSDNATRALNELNFRGQAITADMAKGITDTYATMASQIYAGLDKHYNESIQQMQQFFAYSQGLSEAEQAEMLAKMKQHHADQTASVADNEARIKKILETASAEKRALTRDEQQEINAIQLEMKETAVRTLSENELEARVILERMKQFAGEMTAQQAAEVVQNSATQRDGAIAAAEEQYDAVITTIIKQRDEAGIISREQAEILIREAGRQRDELINKAKETHEMVVDEAKKQADSHINSVDWETGQILTRWQRFSESLARIFASMPRYDGLNVPGGGSYGGDAGSVGANARGTESWRGGLTYVGEEGKELVWLPPGARIFSNLETMSMVRSQTSSATGSGGRGDITQHITIVSPDATSPSENSRQMKRAAQQLALEWI